MTGEPIDALLRKHRKRLVVEDAALPRITIGKCEIERIIPHRDPYLLIDSITGVDHEERTMTGLRAVPPDEPLFRGHFPDYPVYPGTKVVEMIGQLSLCLYYFVRNGTDHVAHDAAPPNVRATRILGAYFLRPIRPGETVVLLARGLDDDGFHARAIGQAVVDGEIACVSAGEVLFL